jgi:AbrB family looped-hinge helix DNA binding protein
MLYFSLVSMSIEVKSMSSLRVSAKGWVVIPSQLRKKYGLTPGRRVAIVDYGGSLGIVPIPDDPIAAMDGMFASLGGASWTEEIIEEHRKEREREERRLAD